MINTRFAPCGWLKYYHCMTIIIGVWWARSKQGGPFVAKRVGLERVVREVDSLSVALRFAVYAGIR